MFDLPRDQEIAIYANRLIISALKARKCGWRDYKLNGSDLFFEIDGRLQAAFTKRINVEKLKTLIQESIKGRPNYKFDYIEFGYLSVGSLPVVWHITAIDKETKKTVKPEYFKGTRNKFDYLVKVYKAVDFQKIKE
ncbi:MAG: hypothetical protein OQK03_11275, partial [Colwellia sp.]|nr:hypothetical protein [Colwellia sp.]